MPPSRRRDCHEPPGAVNHSVRLLQPYNETTAPPLARPPRIVPPGASPCGSARQPVAAAQKAAQASCRLSLSGTGVRLLVGVLSTPNMRDRRDASRVTWLQQGAVGDSVLVCFALGRRGSPPALLAALDGEAAEHDDILFLPGVRDGCSGQHMHVAKAFHFWRGAARLAAGSAVTHVVKTDDDAMLVLPHLLGEMDRFRCKRSLYLGPIAWVGLNPVHFAKMQCGWSWNGNINWRNYGCAKRGFHPAFPFALGALELLSVDLVAHVASDEGVAQFVRATLGRDVVIEDPILGFWLSAAHASGAFDVTYAHARVGNFNCYRRNAGMGAMEGFAAMHHLKYVTAQQYVWDMVKHGVPYEQANCSLWTKERARWSLREMVTAIRAKRTRA